MDNILIQDVCEVYLKDLSGTGTQYFFGLTTKNEITQKIKQDFLKGGIGNGTVGVVQSEKEINFKVTTLLHNDSIYAIQSGCDFTSQTIKTMYSESVISTVAGKVTPTLKIGTTTVVPTAGSVVVMDGKGKQIAGTWTSPDFTATTPADIAIGSAYTVFYQVSNTNAQVLTLDSKKFPKNYYVELHTIAYDVDKNTVVADIYWQFNKALPNGGLQAQYEAGKANGDDVEFIAQLLSGNSSYGNYVVMPRA